MDTISILEDGIIILCIGMGVVFTFLVLLVYSMNLMAYVIKKINAIFPEELPVENKHSKKNKIFSESEIALAITLCHSKR